MLRPLKLQYEDYRGCIFHVVFTHAKCVLREVGQLMLR